MCPQEISPRQRRLRAAIVLALPLLAIADLGAILWARSRPSLSSVAVQALRDAFTASYRAGDLVVASPPTLATPAISLLGSALPQNALTFAEPSRFERALELSLGGARSRDLSGWKQAEEKRVGPVRLRTWVNPKPLPSRFDLVASLQPNDVRVSHGPSPSAGQPCPFSSSNEPDLPPSSPLPWSPRARFSCGKDPAAFVGAVVLEDRRGNLRRCVWIASSSDTVRITWPRVPAGTLLRTAAIVAAPLAPNPNAELRVIANRALVAQRQIHASNTFEPVDIAVSALSAGGELSIELEQHTGALLPICVEATLR